MTDYLTLAADLAEKAPAQAKLLRHVLVHPNQEAPQIQEALSLTDSNFRHLVGKLRDRGVEIVTTRVLEDPADQGTARYIWSIRSDESVEHWAGGRQGALKTSWDRVQKMMIRHLRSVKELEDEERGIIIGKLMTVSEDIARVDVYAQVKIEEAKAAAAAVLAEEAAQLRAARERVHS